MNINDLIGMLGGTTIVLAVVGWLVRSLIVHYLSKDVDAYKERLNSQTQIKIEQLKSELAIAAQTQQIKFSHLHEKQAEAIETLYRDVERSDQLSKLMIGNFAMDCTLNEKIEGAEQIAKEYLEINARFHGFRLYFSEGICSLFTSYRYSAFEPAMKLMDNIPDVEKEKFIQEYLSNVKEMTVTLEQLKSALQAEFRHLLGVIK
jgi:hypothetical protein